MTKSVNQTGIVAKSEAAVQKPAEQRSLKDWVQVMEVQFAKALPKVITAERFTRIALTALSSTPKLMECTRDSFLGALMQAAQLGVEPNTPLGQAYLIPFNNTKKKCTECQFQLGYKGMIDLAYRSGEVKNVQAHIVYENDEFDYELGLEPVLKHKPATNNRGDAVWVYAVFNLKNGGCGFEVMSMEDIKKHAQKYSQAYKSEFSPWQSNFEEMAKKTVLKRVLKYAPLRSDFITADDKTYTVNSLSLDNDIEPIVTADYVIDEETGEVVEDNSTNE